ncbi:c-type cytochrome [Caldimonas brevitalea]|uniref:Cytochrome C553 n=1 Tax=Caldimonas brevitalea TaxID=413882 RepID=A0A0G3BDJ9_9BURK|nr:c-type cytochrome [Caldimonas brevitalea]AKJ27479.1 cytochrome C553 [Caldimonas brevitalea]
MSPRPGFPSALLALLACTAAHAAPPRVPDTIAQRTAACTTCHGKEGRATNQGYFPRIAGKPAGYLYNQLINFREGRRQYGLMTYLVEHLSDAYLMEMAQHFASLDLPYPPPQTIGAPAPQLERGRRLVLEGDKALGVPACAACHGERLTGVKPAIPGLLGLPRDYLNGQLGAWKTGQRRAHAPDCMKQVSQALAPEDIGAVSTWLSSQPLPADTKPAEPTAAPLPLRCGGLTP